MTRPRWQVTRDRRHGSFLARLRPREHLALEDFARTALLDEDELIDDLVARAGKPLDLDGDDEPVLLMEQVDEGALDVLVGDVERAS